VGGNIVTKTLTGIVHGNTIELLTDAGVADGAQVEIQLRVISGASPGMSKLIERAEEFEWTDEDDRILEEIARDRRRGYPDPKDD
jgi:hypothetical protein